MRRTVFALIAAAALAGGCSADDSASLTSASGTRSCVATDADPQLGTVAFSTAGFVRVWVEPGSTDYVELPRIGGDPNDMPTEGDPNIVSSLAVDPATCTVFVGLCCEPVSGSTYWGRPEDDWSPDSAHVLVGALPAVSPSGKYLALVGYEALSVYTLSDPETTTASVQLAAADDALYQDSMWLDDATIALVSTRNGVVWYEEIDIASAAVTRSEMLGLQGGGTDGDVPSVALLGTAAEGDLVVAIDGEVSVLARSDLKPVSTVSGGADVTYQRYGLTGITWLDGGLLYVADPSGTGALELPGDYYLSN